MELSIDGRQVAAEPGTTILQAARGAGIDIPTLCQDDRLDPIAACRLCLVEVEGARTPLVACDTAVSDGMVVATETEELAEQRRALIDLLLSDHHNDCIICDQAGGCRLQEMAYRYDVPETTYVGEKRAYETREDTPFIAYDPGKCILCGRCVAMCQEVQGCHVLDFAERGFDSYITTSFGRSMVDTACEMCGNCVSTCPTGALQDKLSRQHCRIWDAQVVRSVCPFCGCGCTLDLHVKDGKVIQISSPVGLGAGEGNLCVKGRYGFQFIGHPDRLTQPLVRKDGELVPATWDEALDLVVEKLGAIKAEHGADAIAGF
ncbi:MAG: (2Fe-2S)-binding protein, partial [Thermoleophilia bacterium]|nr:(2Fe-2S)-binding protein [Thermoleophilia bacterium]